MAVSACIKGQRFGSAKQKASFHYNRPSNSSALLKLLTKLLLQRFVSISSIIRSLPFSVSIIHMVMASSASTSTPNIAADSNTNNCYDVFINHRGPDVKKTFASHLYHRLISYGLRVFLDYQELQEGEDLTSQIKAAIKNASAHVAIFSPTYADSQWCLDELVLMVESSTPIIPVFHNVKPAEVRRTRGEGVYARSLYNLEKKRAYDSQPRYSSITTEKWRDALSRVADISGLDLEAFNGDEGELVDKVVDVVFKNGVKTQLSVARYPTGLDDKVKDFDRKISLQNEHSGRIQRKIALQNEHEQYSGRVQIVGITGLGGVGKTTLAKKLFNRESSNYKKSYFLSDIREKTKSSLHSLQSEVLRGLFQYDRHVDSRHQGTEILRKHLSSSKVLLVLDDVDDVDQVEALLPVDDLCHDSLILITSRDKDILTRSRVPESSIYKLTGLNTELSRVLFCSHAFCQPFPPSGFEYLVDKILKACHGLPLFLKVFGGRFYGNSDISQWEDELKGLEQTLPHEIQKTLQISYNALPSDEQQMFLDIACFFIGQNRDTAIQIWEVYRWNGRQGLRSLLNKCMVEVEVENENKIRMHDHLRDLGRDLAAKDSKWPRLIWRGTENIDDLSQQSFGLTDLRGISMLRSEYRPEDDKEDEDYEHHVVVYRDDHDEEEYRDDDALHQFFSSDEMSKLQLLHIDIKSDLRGLHSRNLIWLCWHNCPCSSLPTWISMKKLRVLQVRGCQLETLWQDELQAPSQLRQLQIDAPGLTNIPKSISHLKHLKHLRLSSQCMRYLPDSFGNLTNLEHIDLSNCGQLERLPSSFGNLIKLKYLYLRWCTNITLSSGSFGNITTLEYIYLWGCHKIVEWPSQFAHQRSLKVLSLHLSNLKEWPTAIGEPGRLEKLVLKTPLLKTFPSSLGHDLMNLKSLELLDCRSLKSMLEICSLTKLQILKIGGCFEVRELSVETLVSLEEFLVDECVQLKRIRGLAQLAKLRKLSVQRCFELEETPGVENLTSLEKLQAYDCMKLKSIRCSAQQIHLRELMVSRCSELEELPGLQHLRSLETLVAFNCLKLKSIQGLAQLTELLEINVSRCSELEELPGLEYLRSLEKLKAFDCVKLKSIQGLAQLTELRELNVSGWSELEELPGLEYLRSLEKLWAFDCVKLKSIQGLAQLTRLRELIVYGCSELEELPDLKDLRSLEKLSAYKCVKLKSIPGLAQLTELRDLQVSECSELEELPGLEYLRSLEKLWAFDCVKLKSVHGLAQLTHLRKLYVYGCSELEELPDLKDLKSLEQLWAYKCVKLKSIQGLSQLTELRKLDVSGCSELEELPGLEYLRSLEQLRAFDCVKLKSIHGLAQLTELRELDVSGCSELEKLPDLKDLRSLEQLWAFECVKLKSIQGLAQLTELRELDVSGCSELEQLPGLEYLRSLEKLKALDCVKLKSIPGSAQLTELRELDVSGCSELEELPGLEYLRSLEKLKAFDCVKLKSVHGLAQLAQLVELNVSGCSEIEELPGVEQLRSLEKLWARGCVKLKTIKWLAQLTRLREVDVSGCSQFSRYARCRAYIGIVVVVGIVLFCFSNKHNRVR